MKKKIKFVINSGGGLLLALIYSSLIGVGFSSWIEISDTNNNAEINLSVGDVTAANLKKSILYIENSEKGFDYYIYDNNYYFKETSYSIRLKISPSLIEDYISTYSSISLSYGLQYSCLSTNEFDIFSNTNDYIIAPSRALYFLDLNPSFYVESNECEYKSYQSQNNTIYELDSTVPIFGSENSLYSFTKKYQKNTEYIYLTAKYYFTINDSFLNHIEKFNNLTMNFYMSIGSIAS